MELLFRTSRRLFLPPPLGALSAIRIRLAADTERRLVYLIEVPERASEALRTALCTSEGVEERPLDEVLSAAESEGERTVLRTELVLARLRRRLRREARRLHGERRDWAALLDGEQRRRTRPDLQEQVERRGAVQAVDAKLRESGELFEAQILLRSEAPSRGRAEAAMSGLLAAFRPLAERNYLKASGLPIPGLASSAPICRCGAGASSAASPPASSGRLARRS